MSALSQKLRALADRLRKEAAQQTLPKPIPNPVASKAKGDMGSLEKNKPPKSAGDSNA